MSGLRERAFLRGTFTAGLAAGLLALSSGCLSFAWTHDHTFRPLRKDALVDLEEGTTTLTTCLDRLGAPLYVWEYKGDGAAIAWGFGDNDSKRIAWTIPLQRARPTISFGTIDAKLRGAVLLFDRDLVLEEVKQGYLRDLAKELQRKRPAPVEADAPGDEKKP
jgi:hypothetical protein